MLETITGILVVGGALLAFLAYQRSQVAPAPVNPIFADDPEVFTFSVHGAKNYPLVKARSTLDIELPDNTSDEAYLKVLADHLSMVFRHNPEIVFYLAGADPYIGDKLGKLALSFEGLRHRDEMVLNECYEREIPVVTVMSGGYGQNIRDTVDIHCNTIRTVRRLFVRGENGLSRSSQENR